MKFLTISLVYSVICCIFAPKLKERTTVMKILFPERIEEFSRKHADAKEALERWSGKLADAEWKSHADLKADFPSADFVGNNRYVFNIKGNNYRTVVLVVFFAGTVAIRFIGTHSEYDKIKDIKNI